MIYVTLGTNYMYYSKVVYAGDSPSNAAVRGEQYLIKNPSGKYEVQIWEDGGFHSGHTKYGPKNGARLVD